MVDFGHTIDSLFNYRTGSKEKHDLKIFHFAKEVMVSEYCNV